MSLEQAAIILIGALAAGFVNGLTGFGTGLTALGIWLYALSPAAAASLVITTSVASQLQTLPVVWGQIDWRRAWRFTVPGILGVPVGALLLTHIDARTFKLGVGWFLVVYSGIALARFVPRLPHWGGRSADAGVGFVGGVLGGLAGLSGALVVMWTDVRGDSKDARRSLLQVFNLVVLAAALMGHAVAGHLGTGVLIATLTALPGTMIGALIGTRLYARLGDGGYRRIVLALLLASGLALVIRA